MPINFPDSPTNGQEFTSGATTWTYNGTAWDLKTTTTASNDSMPVGSIMWFAGTTAPTGWVLCNGATYTNSTYPNLVAVIGTTFGGTPGTNFMVPNISATTGAYYIRFTTAVGVTSTLSLLSAPVGSMVQWPVTSSYPTGWLRCDGANISRTSYADLFALIGTTYGSGDGSSTFTLPNISAAGSGSPVYIIKGTSSGLVEPSTVAHAASHTEGGSDVVTITGNQIANYQSNRNVIINGHMAVAQRSVGPVTGDTTGGYRTADRWRYDINSMGTWTHSVENDAPTGSGLRKSLKVLCTTADSSPASTDYVLVRQGIEGQNLQHFAKGTSSAKKWALSFWVKSNVTGTYIAYLNQDSVGRTVGASYTISSSGTWEKKTIVFPADTNNAINNDNTIGIWASFALGAGSSYTSGTLNTVWGSTVSANLLAGQVNVASATNNYWQVTGVQLEAGDVATPFEFETFEAALNKCERYYRWDAHFIGITMNSTQIYVLGRLDPPMRAAPTVGSTGALNAQVDGFGANTTQSAQSITLQYNTYNSFYVSVNNFAGLTAGRAINVGVPANNGQYFTFDAEL